MVQKRFKFPEGTVELYAEKVANRGLCAVAQAESLRYKLLGGLAVRRFAPTSSESASAKSAFVAINVKQTVLEHVPVCASTRVVWGRSARGATVDGGPSALRSACYGVLRFVMESGAKGCEVIVSGKLRAQRAKSMKFKDGYMVRLVRLHATRISRAHPLYTPVHPLNPSPDAPSLPSLPPSQVSSGQPVKDYVDAAVRHVLLRQGVLGIKVKIMLDWDPTGKAGPKKPLPDTVTVHKPKEARPALQKPPPQLNPAGAPPRGTGAARGYRGAEPSLLVACGAFFNPHPHSSRQRWCASPTVSCPVPPLSPHCPSTGGGPRQALRGQGRRLLNGGGGGQERVPEAAEARLRGLASEAGEGGGGRSFARCARRLLSRTQGSLLGRVHCICEISGEASARRSRSLLPLPLCASLPGAHPSAAQGGGCEACSAERGPRPPFSAERCVQV